MIVRFRASVCLSDLWALLSTPFPLPFKEFGKKLLHAARYLRLGPRTKKGYGWRITGEIQIKAEV